MTTVDMYDDDDVQGDYSNVWSVKDYVKYRCDHLNEQNASLKAIIIKLDFKVDELSKSLIALNDAVIANKSSVINKPQIVSANLAATRSVSEIDLTACNNQSMMLPPLSTTNLSKRKHNQEANSNSNKLRKVEAKKNQNNVNNNVKDSQWQKPKNDVKKDKLAAKKVHKSFSKSVGTGDFEGLGAVERPHCIQIKRVPNDLSTDLIEEFFKNKIKLKYKDFKIMDLPHAHFKAYTLTINFLDKKVINNKNDWPKGWVVKSFYPPRLQSNKLQNSNNAFQFRGLNTNNITKSKNCI